MCVLVRRLSCVGRLAGLVLFPQSAVAHLSFALYLMDFGVDAIRARELATPFHTAATAGLTSRGVEASSTGYLCSQQLQECPLDLYPVMLEVMGLPMGHGEAREHKHVFKARFAALHEACCRCYMLLVGLWREVDLPWQQGYAFMDCFVSEADC